MSIRTTKAIRSLAVVPIVCASGLAQATTYDITAVLQGNDGGYGFSSFHDASGMNPMSGSVLATINGASGTYDDVTGAFNAILTLSTANPTTVTLSGTLFFDGSGYLNPATTLNADFNGASGYLADTDIGFNPGDVCCSGTGDPNSFLYGVTGGNGFPVLSLWGANWSYDPAGAFNGSYTGSTLGMDLRVRLEPVPLPAAVWLFATGLAGLISVARRKSA